MKGPFAELTRYLSWKDRFLEDYERIDSESVEQIREETGIDDPRLLKALRSMYVGGMEHRVEDPEIRYWTNWAGMRTYETFNGFPALSDKELAFLFYAVGKLFVPLLLHERGVKSESFKALSRHDQEKAVSEELDIIWENHLIRVLQIIPYMQLK